MTDELRAAALALPADERAELAYDLLESLAEEPEADAEAALEELEQGGPVPERKARLVLVV